MLRLISVFVKCLGETAHYDLSFFIFKFKQQMSIILLNLFHLKLLHTIIKNSYILGCTGEKNSNSSVQLVWFHYSTLYYNLSQYFKYYMSLK